jgi:ferredoxin
LIRRLGSSFCFDPAEVRSRDFRVLRIKNQTERRDKMKVHVDPELCCGCGPCVDVCPEAFELNEDGIAVVRMDDVPGELYDACMEAAEDCPTAAIAIEE